MKKITYQIASLIMTLVMILGNTIHTKAAGSVYYVAPFGSDANAGTASAPFQTFAKATSVLTAGSTLNIYTGVYTEQLKITQSGTSSADITIQPFGGPVIINMLGVPSAGLDVRASYVTVSGLEVLNSGDICVNLLGSNITVNGLAVHDCSNHGIQANNSSNIRILNSHVHRTVLSNAARILTGGWGSAIKIRISDNVLIQGNNIGYNYGEGIGTRGTNITIRGNTVHDNYSVNIYTNSENVLIEKNFVYCQPYTGYERNGLPASGISMGEEYFEGWGARLKNAKVLNNIIAFCRHGVRYNGSEDFMVGGLKNAVIAYNTMYGSTNSALSIAYGNEQAGNLIANNIIWQAQNNLAAVDSLVGLTFQNNLWRAAPPAGLGSPGDRFGEPLFLTAPGYTAESYLPSSGSPAAGAASNIDVADDFFAKKRGPSFDIGAIQFASTVPAPVEQPTATSTPYQPGSPPETIYDNKESGFVYSAGWVEESKGAANGGSFARTSSSGASVTFPFTGQSFSVIYKGGPSYRNMDVYVDGALVGTIAQRHDKSTYKARWDYPGQLPLGPHTLQLVFVSPDPRTNGSVDAVIVR
ncbi:MAG TPA: right-handed parallel beta-helix repeat-containing protein [Anaerolineales bacterium]|nr:right-handed parallel beta-helix repeat-containing protein [Anaerolineales bacterium]